MHEPTRMTIKTPPQINVRTEDEQQWRMLMAARRGNGFINPDHPLNILYAPYCAVPKHIAFCVAHLAQSLDGYIATANGMSHWLSGEADLLHTHRMRALADAVIVGASTIQEDNPQLTVRHCFGPNPVRVIIDPEHRLDGSQGVFHDKAAPTLLIIAADKKGRHHHLGEAEILPIARTDQGLDPHHICRALHERHLYWLFVEGGGVTVSRFLHADALDRLQITISPLIIGSGRPSLRLPEITNLSASLRPRTRRFELGEDIMIECVFHDI